MWNSSGSKIQISHNQREGYIVESKHISEIIWKQIWIVEAPKKIDLSTALPEPLASGKYHTIKRICMYQLYLKQ